MCMCTFSIRHEVGSSLSVAAGKLQWPAMQFVVCRLNHTSASSRMSYGDWTVQVQVVVWVVPFQAEPCKRRHSYETIQEVAGMCNGEDAREPFR